MSAPTNQRFTRSPAFENIGIRRSAAKRLFDLVFSLLALVVTAPLILVLALLVKTSSKGPVFYKSVRLGRGGKIIYCWKFRSMYCDADEKLKQLLDADPLMREEWKQYQKLKDDPRITPIGKILRKTSLDEWPQFWNVLKGDLSVVGPRPPTLMGPPDRFADEIFKWYGPSTYKILSVRPGLTGIWQISGSSSLSFDERVKLEEHYVETRTFFKDLVVVAKTIPALIFSKGAY